MRRSIFIATLTLACSASAGCGDDVAQVGNDETSTTGETSGSETSTQSSGSDDTDSGSSESDSGDETGPEEELPCGNGELEDDEECDDGNTNSKDGCNNICESACGLDFVGSLVLAEPEEWWRVLAMQNGIGDDITLAGNIDVSTVGLGTRVGRLRTGAFLDSQLQWSLEGAPLGSPGTLALPQTHNLTAARMTPGGDVLALGTTTEVLVQSQAPIESYWLAHYDGDDLSETWRVPLAGNDPDLRPLDLAVLEGGDPIVTGSTYVANNDRDAGFARYSVVDGSLVWETRHSGEFNAGYSFDDAYAIAAGEGDRIWGSALLRVDYQTHETNLLSIDPADGSITEIGAPLTDPGGNHRQRPWSIAAGASNDVAIGINVYGPASKWSFSHVSRYVDGELSWTLTRDDLPWEEGDPYMDPQVAVRADGTVLVAGGYSHDFGFATAARVWVVKVGTDGEILCYAQVGEGNMGGVAPHSGFFGQGRGAINLDSYGPGGMGPGSGNNWLGGLRQ